MAAFGKGFGYLPLTKRLGTVPGRVFEREVMSLTKNSTAVQRFIAACFDAHSDWSIREVAISDLGWSLTISHDREEWEWVVQGDRESILFNAENNLCTFSVFAGNPPAAICAAIWAVQPLMHLKRWGWLQAFEEQDFTEV